MTRLVLIVLFVAVFGACTEIKEVTYEEIEVSTPVKESETYERSDENVIEEHVQIKQVTTNRTLDDRSTDLPSCEGTRYTHAPVALDKLTEITPLGNANPPGHTTPTEHTYLHIDKERGSTETVSLMSPGDIVITSITSGQDYSAQGRTEYVIRFSLCDDVEGYFNHVKDISEELKLALANVECEQWADNKGHACEKQLSYKVKGGVVIGEVGHVQGNFDFGTIDYRITLDFVNPERFGTSDYGEPKALHKVCPYDYYDEPLKTMFYDKLEGPDCGEVMQDVPGTLQGNWFFGDSTPLDPSTWNGQLAFIRNNVNPKKAMLVVGGLFTESGSWMFTPKTEGTFNRQFSQVVDRDIYCYEGVNPKIWVDPARRDQSQWNGRIIVKLLSNDELQIEQQDGSCSGIYEFKNPVIYNR